MNFFWDVSAGLRQKKLHTGKKLELYPNPTEGNIYTGKRETSMCNANGDLILKTLNKNTIDLSGQADDIYIIRDEVTFQE